MEIISGFFSFLFNFVGIVSSILGIWSVIRSPEEVKGTLASWVTKLRSLTATKQTKGAGGAASTVSLSKKDSSFGVKRRLDERYTGYLYVLAALIAISIFTSLVLKFPSAPETGTVAPQIDWTSMGGMNIVSLFWMCVILFGLIGAMRGWAKELLVVFSGILALTANFLLVKYLPFLRDLPDNNVSLFWMRLVIFVTLIYFGYETVVTIPGFAARSVRERLTDTLFGTLLGGMNGYMIAGTILAYFHAADYPYKYIIAPAADANFVKIVASMMATMPPNLLGEPSIYFVVIVLLLFVLVVYV